VAGHGKAAELLIVTVRIDGGLFDQCIQFLLAQIRHKGNPRQAAALVPSNQADKADGPSGTASARASSRATHRGFSSIPGGWASGA
jgi:hypothetical protein